MATQKLRAPFPYFGGKSRVAGLVWQKLGPVQHYLEPFFGSGAVLLRRPELPRKAMETVNDLDCYVANFWRALKADREQVEHWGNYLVSETDLEARHRWLTAQQQPLKERMLTDPEYYDAQIAGWWVWGQRLWIGSGWCEGNPRPCLPSIGAHGGRRNFELVLDELEQRLSKVRVTCGDYQRILTKSVLGVNTLKAIGVFLDPPYRLKGRSKVYSEDSFDHEPLIEWVTENGKRPNMRIVLCGYEGDYELPSSWSVVPWKAVGGYGNQAQGRGRKNAGRERLWLSPACLSDAEEPAEQRGLSDESM